MRKGNVNVNGNKVEQFILKSTKDVDSFFRIFPKMKILKLNDTFRKIVLNGGTVITDTRENVTGFFSWRTTGVDNWNIID